MNDDRSTPAPLWRRMAAALYDALVAAALLMFAGAVWIGIAKAWSTGARSSVEDMGHWAVGNHAYEAWLLLVLFAYFAISWRRGGQTLGMRAWRLTLRTDDGAPPPWHRLVVRFLVGLVGMVAAGAGWLPVLFDRRRRALHDFAARTSVVHVPKPR